MYPQDIHSLFTASQILVTLGLLGYVLYLRRLILKEFPSRTTLEAMKREVGELSGDLSDLSDRFTRFQKREGMRAARAEKTSQADLLAEAAAVVANQGAPSDGGSGPLAGKLDLYRKRGH